MSGTRFMIDGFIPDPMPQVLVDNLPEIRQRVRQLMSFCVNINEGQPNEENTTKAVYHKCYHDEDPVRACDPAQNI